MTNCDNVALLQVCIYVVVYTEPPTLLTEGLAVGKGTI